MEHHICISAFFGGKLELSVQAHAQNLSQIELALQPYTHDAHIPFMVYILTTLNSTYNYNRTDSDAWISEPGVQAVGWLIVRTPRSDHIKPVLAHLFPVSWMSKEHWSRYRKNSQCLSPDQHGP